ncbi:MAG: hypothetical protein Q3960_02280 [Lactobacillus sp.]|nr:hypothetical protein [Lactobacillus sp.]
MKKIALFTAVTLLFIGGCSSSVSANHGRKTSIIYKIRKHKKHKKITKYKMRRIRKPGRSIFR